MSTEISESGVWLDETGTVVTSPPERGTQIVAPGGLVDDVARRVIDRAEAASELAPEVDQTPKEKATKRKPAEKRGG